jgi:hypothetical protein
MGMHLNKDICAMQASNKAQKKTLERNKVKICSGEHKH